MRKSIYPKNIKTLGDKIKKARMDLKLPLLEVAKSAHITEGYLSRLESNLQIPSSPILKRICERLNILDVYNEHIKNQYREASLGGTIRPEDSPADLFVTKYAQNIQTNDLNTVAMAILKGHSPNIPFRESDAEILVKFLKKWKDLLSEQKVLLKATQEIVRKIISKYLPAGTKIKIDLFKNP